MDIRNESSYCYNYMLLDNTSSYAFVGDNFGALRCFDIVNKVIWRDYGRVGSRGIICLTLSEDNQNLFVGLASGRLLQWRKTDEYQPNPTVNP